MIWSALKSRLLSLWPRRAVHDGIWATPDMIPFSSSPPVRGVEVDGEPLNLVSTDDEVWHRMLLVPLEVRASKVNWWRWDGKKWFSQSAGSGQ